MASIIKSQGLKPFYLVHPNCMTDLTNEFQIESVKDYNSVILGDAVEGFSYENLNKAFRIIMNTGCPFYSLGLGKFYREDGELTLDVGPFAKALEFATGKSPIIGETFVHQRVLL